MQDDIPYLLLTPGPLTTTKTVKQAMLVDLSTWDRDYNDIVQEVRHALVNFATQTDEYTCVLMQGSGSFSVEATIGTVLPPTGKLLIVTTGAYGERICAMAERLRIPSAVLRCRETEVPDADRLRRMLKEDPAISHVAIVHCETTTGILNPIAGLIPVAKEFDCEVILDAMSSFGGVPLSVDKLGVDYLVSSANKCIQGVPGFGFVIARRDRLEKTKGYARSLSLDLFDQWSTMESHRGKWRYTSPTHVLLAFRQAIEELNEEGGVLSRYQRYHDCQRRLVAEMREIGFQTLLDDPWHSPIITSFIYPHESWFDFDRLYELLKQRRFVVYPGKVTEHDTFRIGTIGDLNTDDIQALAVAMRESIAELKRIA